MSLDKSSDKFESHRDLLSSYFQVVFLLLNILEPRSLNGLSRGSVEEGKVEIISSNCILPVQTAPSKSPLPETDGGEDLLDQPQMTVGIIHNVLHVEKLATRLQHSLHLRQCPIKCN